MNSIWLVLMVAPVAAALAQPVARFGHMAAYDESLGAVVVFGGRSASRQELHDLWSWDGSRWTLIDSGTGPGPRSRGALAYDARERRLVLHGGGSVAADSPETWVWASGRWSQIADTSPGRRSHHVVAFDPASKKVVLYGGGRGAAGPNSDTWILEGARWAATGQVTPPARVLPGVVTTDSAVLMFGGGLFGQGSLRRSNQLWSWSHGTWRLLSETGTPGRIYPGLVWDSRRRRALMFGGETDAGLSADTWQWDGKAWSALATDSVPARSEHIAVYDPRRDRVVVFGGRVAGGTVTNDVWEFDGEKWTKRP